jgi:cell wall assembly regulator SMI1
MPIHELVHAIARGEEDKASELIASGFPVNEPDERGKRALGTAEWGRLKIVEQLLKAGAEVNAPGWHGNSALMMAAGGGHVEVVRRLIAAGADVNQQQQGKEKTALAAAVGERSAKHLQIVEALLAAGADPSFGAFSTVLMRASCSASPAIVKALLEAGANVNAITRLGSALTMAIATNRADNAAVLIEAGADRHARLPADADEEVAGTTPLAYATKKKAKKILALLGGAPAATTKRAAPANPAAVWKRIEACLARQGRSADLNAGASAKELVALEETIAVKLPDDFKKAWRVHDGQNGPSLVPPPSGDDTGYSLMCIAEIRQEWMSWKQLTESGEFKDEEGAPDAGIQAAWWHRGWIPFASNGGGDSFCLDLAPASGGVIGQVITMNHETAARTLLAPSFAAWFAELAGSLEESS